MQTDSSTTPRYRVEYRPSTGGSTILTAGTRLRDVAHALDAHRIRLAERGVRGTVVLVCELAGRDLDLVVRTIGLRLEVGGSGQMPSC